MLVLEKRLVQQTSPLWDYGPAQLLRKYYILFNLTNLL